MTTLRPSALVFAAAAACVSLPASGQQFLVTDTTNRLVMVIDGTTETVVNPALISNDTSGNYNFSLPIEAIQVNGEIWVADQVSDQIVRFDIYGAWIATISAGLDNLRGLTFANQHVYVVNFGTGNGAPGKRILIYDLNGVRVGSFATGDLFDVAYRNGELLVSNTLLDDLERYSLTGAFLGTFHNSDGVSGIDFPSQVTPLPNGEVVATCQTAPIGIYVYDANGTQTAYHAVGIGNRGVARLDNGKFLYTSVNGVHVYDPVTTVHSDLVLNVAPYYVSPYRLPGPPTNYCTAGTSSGFCTPLLTASGTPSASAPSGFTITAQPIDAQRSATVFYGVNGSVALPWAPGSTSYFCVRSPIQRSPAVSTGGTIGNCNGMVNFDWNTFAFQNPAAIGQPYAFGMLINAQCWFRDPPAPKGTNLSDALEFFVQP